MRIKRPTREDRLRILVLATTFPAAAGDGTPEFVLTLSAALARRGARVTVLTPRVRGAVRTECIDGVQVRRFAYFPRRWEGLADGAIMPNLAARPWYRLQVVPLLVCFQFAALRATLRERPDVIHAHWIIPSGAVARTTGMICRRPYVLTAHGGDAYTLRTGVALAVKRNVVRNAASTIPVSDDIRAILAGLGEVRPPTPMGVDLERVRAGSHARCAERDRVLFVGRLVDKKGADVLIRACATIPTVRLVLVGSGPMEPELRSLLVELGVRGRFEMLGRLPHDDVLDQLARAALVALPSLVGSDGDQDGFPVVAAEAIAVGTPVVASRIGGLGELLIDGKTARLVPPGDISALATAISELTSQPQVADGLAAAATQELAAALDINTVGAIYMRELTKAAHR